jgi:hypothetical protein
MADIIRYTNAGALYVAGVMQLELALCKLKLFKAGEITLSAGTTKAELDAAECDFTGYAAKTVTAMTDPLLFPGGGASISTGTVQFAAGAPPITANLVGGGWLETAAGEVLMAWQYETPRGVAGVGDGVPVEQILVFG